MVRSLVVIIVAAIFVFINIDFVFDKVIIGPAKSDFISYKWMCYLGELLNIEDFCMNGVDLEFQNTQLVGQFMLSLSVSYRICHFLSLRFLGVLALYKTCLNG